MSASLAERRTMLDEGYDVRAGSLRFTEDGRVTWHAHGQRQFFKIPTR